MPIVHLTDVRLRGAVAPSAGRLELWDQRTPGLCFRVTAAGVRSFTFRYRPSHGAAYRRLTFGRFPGLSLADARAEAERLRAQVRAGADPAKDKRDGRARERTALSFDALADLYIERYAKPRKASWRNDDWLLRAHIRPVWGKRAAAAITRADAARLLFDVVAVAPTSANRLRSILAKLFSWACDSALVADNPLLGVKKPHREGTGKTRVLGDDEIRVLWRALDQATAAPGTIAALRVLLLLGARPGEVAGTELAELHRLDDERSAYWELPAARMKARKAHLVPLPPLAREIVRRQAKSEFVFAGTFADRVRLARHGLSRTLARVIAGLDGDDEAVARLKANPPTPHDFRRSVATGLARLGIPRDDRMAVLAHRYGDTHEIYDRYDRLPQKRAALEAWERHLAKLIAGDPGDTNIIPLRTAVPL